MSRPDVWKTEETEYYTRPLARPNRYGNVESACSRKVITWSARIGDRTVGGFATKREALSYLATASSASIQTRAPQASGLSGE